MDYKNLTGKQIEDRMVNTVVTSEEVEPEEISELEENEKEEVSDELDEEEKGPGRRPDLKIFFVRSEITPDQLGERFLRASKEDTKIATFNSKFNISSEKKEEDYYLLFFKWLRFNSTVTFLVKVRGNYWEIITIEPLTYVKKTLIKLLELTRDIDSVWIERANLDGVVLDLIDKDSINGFIAKRTTDISDRKVTILVYKGRKDDLALARKDFDTEPTKIYFKRHNSPEVAIAGRIDSDPGCLSIEKILPSALPDFTRIHEEIRERYQESFERSFIGRSNEETVYCLNEKGEAESRMSPKPHILALNFADREWNYEILSSWISNTLLDGYERNKSNYLGYEWMQNNSFLLHDLKNGGMIHLRIDVPRHRLLLSSPSANRSKLLNDLEKFMMIRLENGITSSVFEPEG